MAKTIRLPRLPVGYADQPQLLERYWDEAMTAIEKSLNAILAIPEIQAQLAAVDTAVQEAKDAASVAQSAAADAQTSASDVQAQTDAQAKEASLVSSYVTGYTEPLLLANAEGEVTIKAHQRVYGNGDTVSVSAGTVASGAAPEDTVRIYYDDPSRVGGSVTYRFTVDPNAPPVQTGDRHSVGAVIIPTTGTRPGNGLRPPGYVEP